MSSVYLQIYQDISPSAGWYPLGWFRDSQENVNGFVTSVSGEDNAHSAIASFAEIGLTGWYVVQTPEGQVVHYGRYGVQSSFAGGYQPSSLVDVNADGSTFPWVTSG